MIYSSSFQMLRTQKFFFKSISRRHITKYVQGQSPEPKVREYFYFIDHQGMVCSNIIAKQSMEVKQLNHDVIAEKKFLEFFFKRLKKNNTGRYTEDFPYVSLCGPERNFIRCDDLPIVFTKISQIEDLNQGKLEDWFSYAHTDTLMVPFEPSKIFMHTASGRVYHPAPEKAGGIGLVRSKIAIELSSLFKFENGEEQPPTHFQWKGEAYVLETEWHKDKIVKNDI